MRKYKICAQKYVKKTQKYQSTRKSKIHENFLAYFTLCLIFKRHHRILHGDFTINTTVLKLTISVSIYVFMIQDVFCNLTYKNHLANCRRSLRQAIVQFLFLIRSSDM